MVNLNLISPSSLKIAALPSSSVFCSHEIYLMCLVFDTQLEETPSYHKRNESPWWQLQQGELVLISLNWSISHKSWPVGFFLEKQTLFVTKILSDAGFLFIFVYAPIKRHYANTSSKNFCFYFHPWITFGHVLYFSRFWHQIYGR
jgi:hypothetical protein